MQPRYFPKSPAADYESMKAIGDPDVIRAYECRLIDTQNGVCHPTAMRSDPISVTVGSLDSRFFVGLSSRFFECDSLSCLNRGMQSSLYGTYFVVICEAAEHALE